MFANDEDNVQVVAKRMRMNTNVEVPEVPNVSISNKHHWERFNSSPVIKKSIQSNNIIHMCDICKLEFSSLYPGHKYSYMNINYIHDTCFYTNLGLCDCLVCAKMITFVKNCIIANKVSDKFDSTMIDSDNEEEENNLDAKLKDYWHKFHIAANNFIADMIIIAYKKTTQVASDSEVPNMDVPRITPEPVFKHRNCVNTAVLRNLYTSCAKVFSKMTSEYNIAIINNVPEDQRPKKPKSCILLSALPYYDLHVCIAKISRLM